MYSCCLKPATNVMSMKPFPTYSDAKQVRISQEKHLLTGFSLSNQLISASQSVNQGLSTGSPFFLIDSNLVCIIVGRKKLLSLDYLA